MYFLSKILTILAILITGISTAPPAPSRPTPSTLSATLASNDNPTGPTTVTYIIPNTNVLVRATAVPSPSRHIAAASLTHLISTGIAALDILAAYAGGPHADLDVPRIRWAISGLAIQVSDATR
ncbi:MAG: hypothetical protein Q9211_007071, partial [Gyalolechia sp. 1 TL-2023]